LNEQELFLAVVDEVRKLPKPRMKALLVALKKRPSDVSGLERVVNEDEELKTVDLETISVTYDVSVRSLLRYIDAGKLKATRCGRKFMITVDELKRFFRES